MLSESEYKFNYKTTETFRGKMRLFSTPNIYLHLARRRTAWPLVIAKKKEIKTFFK